MSEETRERWMPPRSVIQMGTLLVGLVALYYGILGDLQKEAATRERMLMELKQEMHRVDASNSSKIELIEARQRFLGQRIDQRLDNLIEKVEELVDRLERLDTEMRKEAREQRRMPQ